ncbi:MAG: SDR family NAD(P)-dependent oxidoreductase [Thermoleophilia bacterium]
MRLDGKVIVVTGGSQGIGEALARRYAREGAAVAILNRDHAAGAAVADSIVADGGRAVAVPCDVSVVDRLGEAVARVHEALGPIDVLVNNAGAFVMSPLGGTDEAAFDLMIGANLKGVFFLSQEVLPDFEAAGRGKIINIGSIFGNDGFPESTIYCATKSAIHMLTKVLALDLRERNIQVNAIAPGFIETPLNAGFRAHNADYRRRADERFGGPGVWMQPEELTGAAVFLASEDSDSVTGATLYVDRGWSAY